MQCAIAMGCNIPSVVQVQQNQVLNAEIPKQETHVQDYAYQVRYHGFCMMSLDREIDLGEGGDVSFASVQGNDISIERCLRLLRSLLLLCLLVVVGGMW